MQEHKVGELQQDLRRVTRDTQHKDTQVHSTTCAVSTLPEDYMYDNFGFGRIISSSSMLQNILNLHGKV